MVEILLARVSGLSREAGEVLAAVAIAGRPVDEALIVEVLAWPEADLRAPLREALDRSALIVVPVSGQFRFRHELLREAVERTLLPGERRGPPCATRRRPAGSSGPRRSESGGGRQRARPPLGRRGSRS
ncbi:MAG: hypothetical protein WKF78_09785 [Candidatus Limnocylindrales bacterium]